MCVVLMQLMCVIIYVATAKCEGWAIRVCNAGHWINKEGHTGSAIF